MRALDAARRALGGHDAKAALPETVTLRSIGIVRSSLRDLRYRDATRQRATLEILPEFAPGFAGLEGFSHVIVLTWLHLVADDERTLASPVASGATAPAMRGALALRTHHRPNPIGLSVVNLDR